MSFSTSRENAGPAVWPVPPRLGQNIVLLPDGSLDPEAVNDCGETCVSSVVLAMRGMSVSPGCWREALGGVNRSGITSADDIRRLLGVVRMKTQTEVASAWTEWERLHHLRHYGAYAMLLGAWLSQTELHWLLAYEYVNGVVWAMDPWTATYRTVSEDEYALLTADQVVRIWQ